MEVGNVLGTDVIVQIAVVVHDIEKTSQAYADFFGIEKPRWKWTNPFEQSQTHYHGRPTEARAKLAFLKVGPMVIELIEPDHHPSTWREVLDKQGEGFHHIAFVIEGMKEKLDALAERRMPLIQKGEYSGGRYAYVDTSRDLKLMIELLENDKK
mgnify:FL=1